NSAMYGISLSVFLDLVFRAFSFEFYYIQFLPLLIYTFAGLNRKEEKTSTKKGNKYIDLRGKY
ncbi:hypothetical protein JXB27_01155, partial [Candidatus Woesearchaeota archaeon]|nr:hypothetical protein [Candidatus Woesearchaeota archaeon]